MDSNRDNNSEQTSGLIDTRVQETKNEFLSYDFNLSEQHTKVYSLENEFIKSKKNRYHLFTLLVVSFLLVVLSIGFIAHIIMREKERNVVVEIEEFQDTKLQELVFSVDADDNKLNTVKAELEEIKFNKEIKTTELENETNRLKTEISAIEYPEDIRNQKLEKIQQAHQEKQTEIENQFQQAIADKTKKLQEIEAQIADNQSKISKHKQSGWAIQNPEQTLYQLKINALRINYENKIKKLREKHLKEKQDLISTYNPDLKDELTQALLNKKVPQGEPIKTELSANENYLLNTGLVSKSLLQELSQLTQNQQYLIAQLKSIPFHNSPQRALLHLDAMSKAMSGTVDKVTEKLVTQLREKIKNTEKYEHFLAHFTQLSAENGYILDPRNEAQIGIYIDAAYQVKNGDTGLVFRNDDEYIGLIQFFQVDDTLMAKIVELAENKNLQPMDKILLNKMDSK